MTEYTLSNRIAGTLLQIKKAIEQLQDWNKDIQNVDDYYSTPEGMKNLAASCMLIEANEQKEGSDVDICVDMEPKMFLVVRLKRFLENLLECSVDIVRIHKRINPYLLKEIEHDGIYIIK